MEDILLVTGDELVRAASLLVASHQKTTSSGSLTPGNDFAASLSRQTWLLSSEELLFNDQAGSEPFSAPVMPADSPKRQQQ